MRLGVFLKPENTLFKGQNMNSVKKYSGLILTGFAGAILFSGCLISGDGANPNSDASVSLRTTGSAADSANGGGEAKVTICHIPPGNPANAHSITVGAPAVRAHLAHGDSIGACSDQGTVVVLPPDDSTGTDSTGSCTEGQQDCT